MMSDWLDSIEAKTRAQSRHGKTNTVGFQKRLNIHTDADIIHWFWGQPSKQGTVKRLQGCQGELFYGTGILPFLDQLLQLNADAVICMMFF